MINRQALLADLQKFLQRIEADLLERSESTEVPEVPAALHAEYEKAAKAERTAQNYEDWRTDTITQAAAAWVLSCVFVRFLEDNSLIDPPMIAGPGERLARARDEHELYFRSHPQHTDREYLLSIFAELARLPGTKDIFGEHNAINDLPKWLSGDAAGELLNFFQKIDASTGALVHDFTDPNWDTRFLGDLYQDLSEAARKKFALLQTPDFVEEFILDRTLEPALEEFGLVPSESGSPRPASGRGAGGEGQSVFKMIDPACGSGHFLLGAFPRLLDRWQRKEPGTNIRELTQRALDSIHGVDINPFAVAIAKFRLLLVAMKSCDIQRLADAPAFYVNVVCGDSLLHGENRTSTGQNLMDFADGATDQELYAHAYPGEDLQRVRTLLHPGTYHCVVANPPYIVPKDRKLNDWYRKRFSACHMKYSLAVPFMQQIFQLATHGGITGQITANSFMKREFGKKLIESFFPTVNLTHVIDTSGAYIPGHGTPTTILFGRNNIPVSQKIRVVMGIKGEPSTPDEPADGLVWRAIVDQIDFPKSESDFVSVDDSERSRFFEHPWSLEGGGANALSNKLSSGCERRLENFSDSIGPASFTGFDDAFVASYSCLLRRGVPPNLIRPFAVGDGLRDWVLEIDEHALCPYDESDKEIPLDPEAKWYRFLWPNRQVLGSVKKFAGKTRFECGDNWWGWYRWISERYRDKKYFCFAFLASHNHYIYSQDRISFNHSVPLVKLPSVPGDSLQYFLCGLLNTSVICFLMKQVCHQKQMTGGDGIRLDSRAKVPYEYGSTAIATLPIPNATKTGKLESDIERVAKRMIELSETYVSLSPACILNEGPLTAQQLRSKWELAKNERSRIRAEQVFLQEELDFLGYALYGLIGDQDLIGGMETPVPSTLSPGARPFCIQVGKNEEGFDVPSAVPDDWPNTVRELWHRRIEAIGNNRDLHLIESPMYKRRWIGRQGVFNHQRTEDMLTEAIGPFLRNRIEEYFDFDGRMRRGFSKGDAIQLENNHHDRRSLPGSENSQLREISLVSIAQIADFARQDKTFLEIGEVYRDDPAFDVQALVEELVTSECVPHLPVLCYKEPGLRKRAEWEKTWELQRREDLGESIATIPVPPTYVSGDFISAGAARYWSLRGKLDVPKERWISFPHCEGPDGTLVICWAGYDHLQQAQAISAYYVRVQTEFGGSDDPRLIPLLASLIELLPWLKQWHNEPNASFDGLRMGDYFEGFVNEEARALGKTFDEIRAWTPPKGQRGRVAKGQSGRKKGQSRKGSKGQSEEGAAEA